MVDEESIGPTTPDTGPKSIADLEHSVNDLGKLRNLAKNLDRLGNSPNAPNAPTLDDVFDQQT